MSHKCIFSAWMAFAATVVLCLFSLTAQPITAEEVGPDGIANLLQPYVDSEQLPGFLSILADRDKILQIDRIGYGDIAAQRGMLEDRLVWMASTTKLLTGAALMTLVDAGKVNLDEPLETYIPELTGYKVAVKNDDGTITLREPASKPTVRQAISHTTGWLHATPLMERFGYDSLPLQSFATVLPMIPMMTDPGTTYHYSNSGIDLAGIVIENVSGMPYEDYVQKTFFDPLEMKVSSFYPAREHQDLKNKAYYWKDGKLTEENTYYRTQPLEDKKIRHAEAGGGWFSTPLEVLKFFQMLANKGVYGGKRYLSEAAIAEMCTNQLPANPDDKRYGIGTMFFEDGWYGHDGSYGTRCMYNPELGLIRLYITQIEENVPKRNEVRTMWTKVSSQRMKELTENK